MGRYEIRLMALQFREGRLRAAFFCSCSLLQTQCYSEPEEMSVTIDERLEAVTQSLELLTRDVEGMRQHWEEVSAMVERHQQWQHKVERSLVAGIEAALREWRNGEQQ